MYKTCHLTFSPTVFAKGTPSGQDRRIRPLCHSSVFFLLGVFWAHHHPKWSFWECKCIGFCVFAKCWIQLSRFTGVRGDQNRLNVAIYFSELIISIAFSNNSSLPARIPLIVGLISMSGTIPTRCVSLPSG
jgi:hypothetical protein